MWAEGEPNGDFRVLSALLAFPPGTMFLVVSTSQLRLSHVMEGLVPIGLHSELWTGE